MKKRKTVRHQALSDMSEDSIDINVILTHCIITNETLKTSQRKLKMHIINFFKTNKNR